MVRRYIPLVVSLAVAGCATSRTATHSTPVEAAEVERSVVSASPDEAFVGELPDPPPGRRVLLTLGAGGAASLVLDSPAGKAPAVEAGRWKADGPDLVRVEFTRAKPGSAASPLLLFRDGLVLTAREWDRTAWGADGPRLKVFPLVGRWRRERAQGKPAPAATGTRPDPATDTLEFLPDGRVLCAASGQSLAGRWSASPRGALSLELAPAAGSMESLRLVRAYRLDGEVLQLDRPGDGELRFVRVR